MRRFSFTSHKILAAVSLMILLALITFSPVLGQGDEGAKKTTGMALASGDVEKKNAQTPVFVPVQPGLLPKKLTPVELSSRRDLLVFYCVVILLSSVLGGFLPRFIKLTHTRMQILMSFVGGLMLGVALFHLLLHAVLDVPKTEFSSVMTSLGLGILTMFLLLRVFHFHQHDMSDDSVASEHAHGHAHCHDHDDGHAHGANEKLAVKSRFAWVGIAFGLGLHSIMDGIALTVSTLRPAVENQQIPIWGLAAFLAVLLHKPLDAISITSVMSASGWKSSTCTAVNFSFALMCPIGAMLAWWGIVGTHSHIYLMSHLLAFSAGVFFCVSLSDLLPEMQFHAHNQAVLTVSLVAGLGLAWGLMWLDPAHGF